MQQSVATITRQGSFWLSLLLHLLLLLSFVVILVPRHDDERHPELYIPSYISSPLQQPVPNPAPPVKQATPLQQQPQPTITKPVPPAPQQKKAPVSKNGIEKPATAMPQTPASQPAPRAARQTKSMNPSLDKQGIHLIGDEKIDKSLRTILGKAIGAHLFYPRNAIEFGVKGTVLIGFTLHPDGQVTGIQLVKPSPAGILNSAALSAINEISPVEGVGEFVSAPRYLIVGIIFD